MANLFQYIVEVVGYIGRALAYNATGQLIPYIVQSTFLLLAPILFAASLYMTLSRIIRAVDGERYALIPARWLTGIFVFCDAFSFLIQGSGAGLLVRGSSNAATGQNIIIGGLVFQIGMFALFCLVTLMFNLRIRRRKSPNLSQEVPWQGMLAMLYVTSAFIMIRNVFRTVQYAAGQNGYLVDNEWTVYGFDGSLMLLTMLCFALRYPNRLGRRKAVDSSTELT